MNSPDGNEFPSFTGHCRNQVRVRVDPDGIAGAPAWLDRLSGFVEIHIDQTTELAGANEPVGIVTSLASRTRLEAHLAGDTPGG